MVSVVLAAQLDRCANPFFTPDAQLFSDLVDGNHYEFETSLFDGVAAIALAMNAADEDADAAQGQEALSVGENLRKKLLNVSFDGASGPVALDAQGDRDSTTIQFALESFGDPLSVEPLTLAYEVFVNASTPTTFEMAATAAAPVQWIVGSEGPNSQPEDAVTRKVRGFLLLAPRNPPPLPSNVSFSAQTHDAHASVFAQKWQLLDKREADEREAAQKQQQAARREIILVIATCVILLIASVATLSLTIWWVRVRRVAHLYHVKLAATQTCGSKFLG